MTRWATLSALMFALGVLLSACDVPPIGGGSAAQSSASASSVSSTTGGGGQGGTIAATGGGGAGGEAEEDAGVPPCAHIPCDCPSNKVGYQCSPQDDCHCAGAPCKSGFATCDLYSLGECDIDLLNTWYACGDCYNRCSGASCVNGACACDPGLTYCPEFGGGHYYGQEGCYDTQNSIANCGGCGGHCGFPWAPIWECTNICQAGQCTTISTCPSGMAPCDGLCTCSDVTAALDDCGQCGNVCPDPPGPNMHRACVASVCSNPCDAGYADCDGDPLNGCETAPASDPMSCGACGHSCLGGACSSGVCQPVVLAVAQAAPFGIALDATRVFWTNQGSGSADGSVMAIDKTLGGAPLTLASGRPVPHALVVSGGEVFWTEPGLPGAANGSLLKAPVALGSVTALATGQGFPLGVAADATSVYWANSEGNVILSLPLAGGAPTTVASKASPRYLAIDTTSVFFTTATSIERAPLDGSAAPTVLAAGLTEPWGVVVDSSYVRFTLGSTQLGRVPIGGGPLTLLVPNLVVSRGLALDATEVVFASSTTLYRLPLAGGALSATPASPTQIAIDAAAIYWTDTTAGTVMKLAR